MAERLGMVIDMKGCVACASCAVACKVETTCLYGVWWNRILTDGGDNPDTRRSIPEFDDGEYRCCVPALRESCVREGVPCWSNVQRS